MQLHESRDLDAMIDGVARAMTSGGSERDLRPAIAARLAAAPSWPTAWRVAVAGAALAVLAVAVAVVSRSGGEPQQTRSAARPDDRQAVATGREPRSVLGPATSATVRAESTEPTVPRSSRPAARVARQTIVRTSGTEDAVVIRPMAIVPLEEDDVATTPPRVPQVVTIAPIDVAPVRISELGELVE